MPSLLSGQEENPQEHGLFDRFAPGVHSGDKCWGVWIFSWKFSPGLVVTFVSCVKWPCSWWVGLKHFFFIIHKYLLPRLGAKVEVQAHGRVASDCTLKPLPFGSEERGSSVILQTMGSGGWVSSDQWVSSDLSGNCHSAMQMEIKLRNIIIAWNPQQPVPSFLLLKLTWNANISGMLDWAKGGQSDTSWDWALPHTVLLFIWWPLATCSSWSTWIACCQC